MLFRNWNLLPASLNGQKFLGFSTAQPFLQNAQTACSKILHQIGMRQQKRMYYEAA